MKNRKNPLEHLFEGKKGKTLVFGIGNTLRGDDGVGSVLVKKLEGKTGALCLDGGSAPENYLGKILKAKPDTILIIDAVHMNTDPGEYRLMKPESLGGAGITTHSIPLPVLTEYLESQLGSDIYILGVQPRNVGLGDSLSDAVERTVDELERMLTLAIPPSRIT
jgi:hydrogenase 3 maturation protease